LSVKGVGCHRGGCWEAWVGQVWFFKKEGCQRARVGWVWAYMVVYHLILVLQNLDEVEVGQSHRVAVVCNT